METFWTCHSYERTESIIPLWKSTWKPLTGYFWRAFLNGSGFIGIIVGFIKEIKGHQYHIQYSGSWLKDDLIVGVIAFAVDRVEGLQKGAAMEHSFLCVIYLKQNSRVSLKRHNGMLWRVLLAMITWLCLCVYLLSYAISFIKQRNRILLVPSPDSHSLAGVT